MGNPLISNAGDGCAIRGDAAGTPAASLLSLAAAPTFVVMALWSAVAGGPAEMMCNSGGSALSLNGMAAMYALMSVFHVSPWLTLLSNRRNVDGGRSSALTLTAQRNRKSLSRRRGASIWLRRTSAVLPKASNLGCREECGDQVTRNERGG